MSEVKRYSFRLYEPRDRELIEWLDMNDSPKGTKNTIIRLALLNAMNNGFLNLGKNIEKPSKPDEPSNPLLPVVGPETQESPEEVDLEAEEASAKLMSLFG